MKNRKRDDEEKKKGYFKNYVKGIEKMSKISESKSDKPQDEFTKKLNRFHEKYNKDRSVDNILMKYVTKSKKTKKIHQTLEVEEKKITPKSIPKKEKTPEEPVKKKEEFIPKSNKERFEHEMKKRETVIKKKASGEKLDKFFSIYEKDRMVDDILLKYYKKK